MYEKAMVTRQDESTAPVNTSEYIIPYSDVKINTNEEDIIMSTQTIKAEYRTIYLDDDARHYYGLYFDSRKDDCPYMFPRSRKPYGKMTTCGFRAILKTIRKRAELTCRVYPHKSRKTLGMNLKNRGVDIGTIQEIM